MILCFKLSMPNIGSWNGKCSREENLYVKIRNLKGSVKSKSGINAQEILTKGYFRYDFGDGWAVGITVTKVDSKEAAKLRRKTQGFLNYDWMIDSIIEYLEIRGKDEF